MEGPIPQEHGDGYKFSTHMNIFLADKCNKFIKLKTKLRKLIPSTRICTLALPKYRARLPKILIKKKFRPHIQVTNLDIRPRTRLEQLAFPSVRRLLETRDTYKNFYHTERYYYINQLIRKSLFSLYSRLANVQPPKKPFQDKPWTQKDWKRHTKILKKLAKPKRRFFSPKYATKLVPLEELLPRIKKLSKPKKIFLPPESLKQKNKPDINRIFKLAKPKDYDPMLYIKPESVPIDRNKLIKATKRTLQLAEPKDRSAAESDMKDNPFQVSPNALKFKCKEGSRLTNLAKPREYEEHHINLNAFIVNKRALKAKPSRRTLKLAQPKEH